MHQGAAETRAPVTPLGGAPIQRATVTLVLIGLNVAAFAFAFGVGLADTVAQWGMSPAAVSVGGEWWRLLTAMFLHNSVLHIAFNMIVLWTIGPQLEALLGHVRYLVLYLLAGLGGCVASYAFSPLNSLSVGASGAIFGLMAALLVAGRSLRADVTQIAILFGINVVIGFLAPNVDWRAHLGGAVVGAAAAAVLAYAPRTSRVLWQTLGLLAIAGLLVVALLVRTATINAGLPPNLPQLPSATGAAGAAPRTPIHTVSTAVDELHR